MCKRRTHLMEGVNYNQAAAFAIKYAPKQTEATPNHINSIYFKNFLLNHFKCRGLAATSTTIHLQKSRGLFHNCF